MARNDEPTAITRMELIDWMRAQPGLYCIAAEDVPDLLAQGYTTLCQIVFAESQIPNDVFHIMELPQDRPFKATALDAPDYLPVGTGWYSYDD